MDWLEPVAVAFGIVSVWLSTRQNILSWPTALVNVALYFVIFGQHKLYADMGLQVVYFALSLYGSRARRMHRCRGSTPAPRRRASSPSG